MTDYYVPALKDFNLSEEEKAIITLALKQKDPWDSQGNDALNEIKRKIQGFHLERHGYTCCYCRGGLRGRGHFTIDREHILPKSKYKPLTFTISNLSVSCKRCNMEYKGDTVEFVIDPATIETEHTDASRYLFIHPNFDRWEDHLRRISCQYDTLELVVFTVKSGSQKGQYTYTFFRLDRYCADLMDLAQGIQKLDEQGRNLLEQAAAMAGIQLP